MPASTFGARLRALRLTLGLTQKELAARAGCHPGYVSHLEHDRRDPRKSLIEALAQALGVPPGELLGGVLLLIQLVS